jgi:YD repeat-containing protein
LICQFQCFAKPYQPQVKGGFKSFTTTEYRYDAGKPTPKSVEKISTTILDKNGNMVETIFYEKGKITQKFKITNKYDEKGLLIETIYFDMKGKPFNKNSYNYDSRTNKINDTTKNASGEITQIGTYVYDKNDFLIQEIHKVRIDKDEFSTGVTYFKNDKFGNRIEEYANNTSEISANVSSEINLDDKAKNKSDVSVQSKNSGTKITYNYKYDKQNNIIKDVRTSFDNFKLVHEYKYDEFGNITEILYPDDKGKIVMKNVNEYSK